MNCGKILVFVFSVLVLDTYEQNMYLSIECPIPDDGDTVDQDKCDSYSACEFSGGYCSMRNNRVAGYVVSSQPTITSNGFMVTLDKANPSATMFEADVEKLMCEVIYRSNSHVQIKIYEPSESRYEVPYELNYEEEPDLSSMLYEVTTNDEGNPFVLAVNRIATGINVLKSAGPLTFEDQFLQFTTALPSSYLYGIGEHAHTKLRHSFESRTTWPIFARDRPLNNSVNLNYYSSFPYYINIEDDDGNTNGVLLYNSNAMEYSTFMLTNETAALTIRAIGGILDFHVFLGPTPEEVNVQYAQTVGLPVFPQYWALGYHLSRWGYDSTDDYRVVRDRMKNANIPQDGQFFDIDYMDKNMVFTVDSENWSDFPQLIQELHDDNVKVFTMMSPSIVADFRTSYFPALRGKINDVFIKWMSPDYVPDDQTEEQGQYVVGFVDPENKTVFPDFMKNDTIIWWSNEFSIFHSDIEFDAAWIDMNEPVSYGTNMDRPDNYPEELPDWSLSCPKTKYDTPPYPTLAATGNDIDVDGQRLSAMTICMTSNQTYDDNEYSHYDVHSLYGHAQAIATYSGLQNISIGDRPVILTRSSFPGTGKYAFTWNGDNLSTWEQLKMSIIGIMEFNMFAMPMAGSDICGFSGNTTEELCIRWTQLGAFYPFSRNHNAKGSIDQDPASPDWTDLPEIAREVLLLRYRLLPYMYARMWAAHNEGHSVFRPLFVNFPADKTTRDIDDQFMWSNDLLVAPVVEEGATSRKVYFPESRWFDILTGDLVEGPNTKRVSAPQDKIPVYVRGGSIIPWQEPGVTTTESRLNPFGLTVAPNEYEAASGEIIWDDGVSDSLDKYTAVVEFYINELRLRVIGGNTDLVTGLNLETIEMFGVTSSPNAIIVNGIVVDDRDWTYSESSNTLSITTSLSLEEDFIIFVASP